MYQTFNLTSEAATRLFMRDGKGRERSYISEEKIEFIKRNIGFLKNDG